MDSAALPGRRFFLTIAGLLHLVCPLLFFIRRTENPYLIQIVLLHFLAALAAAVFLLLSLRAGKWVYTATAMDGPLALWAGAAAFSWLAAFALHGGGRWSLWAQGLPGLLYLGLNALAVFFLGAQLARGAGAARLRALTLAVGGTAAVYALLQYHGVDPVWPKAINPFIGRPVSTYGNPNFLSTALAILAPLALREFLTARTLVWLKGGLFFLMAGALVSTMTRSTYIGAAAGLALYLWLDRASVIRARGRAAAAAVILLALVFFWPASRLDPGAPSPAGRLVDLWVGVTGEKVYGSWHQRLLIWSAAWGMWRDNFLLGKGWGLFELFFPFYQAPLLRNETFRGFQTHANNAHQLFLELGSQTGLVGLGIFLWVVALGVYVHRRSSAAGDPLSLAGACAGGLAAALVDNIFGNVSLFFAVPALLFFWTAGQWAALLSGREESRPMGWGGKAGACLFVVLCAAAGVGAVRDWQGAAWHLRGLDASRAGDWRAGAAAMERSRRWNRREVNNAYQLGALYLRQARWSAEQGLAQETERFRALARGAFEDAGRANPGYSEIYLGLAALDEAEGRTEDAARHHRLAQAIDPFAGVPPGVKSP